MTIYLSIYPSIILFIHSSNYISIHLSMLFYIYIYIYAFSRRFYPNWLTVYSGYFFFISMCVPWELNPQPFALLTQCSTTEPQEHYILISVFTSVYCSSTHVSFCPSILLSIYCLSNHPSICPPIYPSNNHLLVYLSLHHSVYPFIHLYICPSVYLLCILISVFTSVYPSSIHVSFHPSILLSIYPFLFSSSELFELTFIRTQA